LPKLKNRDIMPPLTRNPEIMSRICDACGRSSNRANNRSHSRVATKRQQHVNLQSKKIDGVKSKVCTRCLKTLTKKQEEQVQPVQKVPQAA